MRTRKRWQEAKLFHYSFFWGTKKTQEEVYWRGLLSFIIMPTNSTELFCISQKIHQSFIFSGFTSDVSDKHWWCIISFIDASTLLPPLFLQPSLFMNAFTSRSRRFLFVNPGEKPYEQHKEAGENHNYGHAYIHSIQIHEKHLLTFASVSCCHCFKI
mgnify:CR=1 FL=1